MIIIDEIFLNVRTLDCLLILELLFIVARCSCGCWLEGSSTRASVVYSGAREEHLNIGSPFQDDPDGSATESNLHLNSVPGSLLQFFREKWEAVFRGNLPSEFSLKIEITLYNCFISQLKRDLTCSKEK